MSAVQMAAAAALGYAGASATSFVLPSAGKAPVSEAVRVNGISSQGAAPQGAAPMAFATVAAGIAAAAGAKSKRANRVHMRLMDRVNGMDTDLTVPQTTATEKARWRPGQWFGVPYKKSIYPDVEVDVVYEEEIISYKPRVIENFAGGLVGSESSFGLQYDPLELSGMYPEHVPWYREAELKHGRVAMLAMVGLIAQDTFRIPGLEDPSITVLNAHNKLIYGLGNGPMWWLLVFCALIESQRFKDLGLDFGKLTHENAGDLGLRGLMPKTPEGMKDMQLKELKNGRLAMLAFSGCITQAAFFGQDHFPFYGGAWHP